MDRLKYIVYNVLHYFTMYFDSPEISWTGFSEKRIIQNELSTDHAVIIIIIIVSRTLPTLLALIWYAPVNLMRRRGRISGRYFITRVLYYYCYRCTRARVF